MRTRVQFGMANGKDENEVHRAAVDAAVRFQGAKLWARMESVEPVSIGVPGEEEPLICLVLGRGGEEFGISLLRGRHSMAVFEHLIHAGVGLDTDANCDVLMLNFDPRSVVSPAYLAAAERSGRSFGEHAAVPVFATLPQGLSARPMDDAELGLMTWVLRTLVAADTTGSLRPRAWDRKRRTLELRLERSGAQETVHDSVVTWPATALAHALVVKLPALGERWSMVTGAALRSDRTWGVGALPIPADPDDPEDDGPVDRELLFVVDRETGEALPPQWLVAGDPDGLAEAFLDLVEMVSSEEKEVGGMGLPTAVHFQEPRPARQMVSALEDLGIEVSVIPEQPWLEDAMEHFERYVDGSLGEGGEFSGGAESNSVDLWKRVRQRVTEQLLDSKGADEVAMAKARPLKLYFGDADAGRELIHGGADPMARIAYFEWFLLHYRSRKGAATVAERALASDAFDPIERILLEARVASRTIFGRVVSLDRGASIDLENCLTGEVVRVDDVGLSKSAMEGLGLIVRLSRVKQWTFASVAGPPVAPVLIRGAIEAIEELGHSFVDGVLTGDQEGMGGLFLAPPAEREVRNSDGESIEDQVVLFRVDDGVDAAVLLSRLDGIEERGDGAWSWVEERSGHGRLESQILMASVEHVGNELLVHVQSAERAQRVRDWLADQVGLTFLAIRPALSAQPGAEIEEETLTPEELAEVEAYVQGKIMAWLDEPVPAFDGRTPREAANDPKQRAQVERMIRTYPDPSGPTGPIRAPRAEMLRALGFAP